MAHGCRRVFVFGVLLTSRSLCVIIDLSPNFSRTPLTKSFTMWHTRGYWTGLMKKSKISGLRKGEYIKMIKKIMAAIAAVTVLCGTAGCLPKSIVSNIGMMNVCAAEKEYNGFIYEEKIDNKDELQIKGYKGEGGAVKVPAEIDGKPVTEIYQLSYNNNITELYIPEGVRWINGQAFIKDSALKQVTLPGTLEYVGFNLFQGCDALETLVMNEGIKELKEYALSDLPNLSDITFPSTLESVGRDALRDTKWLKDRIAKGGAVIEKGVLFNGSNCTGTYYVPDGVRVIAANAFEKNTAVENIVLPVSVTCIGYCAFSSCSRLSGLNIPASVSMVGDYAFDGTPWLEKRLDSDPLLIINDLVYDGTKCSGEVVIPKGVTRIKHEAFYANKKITSVDFPSTLETVGDKAFWGCEGLTTLEFPDSLTSIEDDAFRRCINVTAIKTGNGLKDIGHSAFYECSSLGGLTMPESMENIGQWAFDKCTSLESVVFNDGLKSIGQEAFCNCTSLKNVKLGFDIERIGSRAFGYTDDGKTDGLTFTCYEMNPADYYAQNNDIPCEYMYFDINDAELGFFRDSFEYKGEAVEPQVKITFRGNDLTYSGAFDFVYTDSDKIGTAAVEVIPKKLFRGNKTLSYSIVPKTPDMCGDYLRWSIDEDGRLVITGSGDMYDYTSAGAPWYEKRGEIKEVELSEKAASIGQNAFFGFGETAPCDIRTYSGIKACADNAFEGHGDALRILGESHSYLQGYAEEHGIAFSPYEVDIKDTVIVLGAEEYFYEGVPVEPTVEMTYNGAKLTAGVDYTVEYRDNNAPGTGTVIITGCGDYHGAVEKTFTIKEKNSSATVGDVNGDGTVNVMDISKLAAHIKGIRSLTDDELARSEVNGDGTVNVMDISRIAAHVKGKKPLG